MDPEKESTDRSGNKQTALFTLILKPDGNRLAGEMSNNSFRVMDGGSIPLIGYVEGDQLALTGYLDYQGGEHTHMQLTFTDGHLAGAKRPLMSDRVDDIIHSYANS